MYDSWPNPRPGKQAMSPAFPDRLIGCVDGPDRPSVDLFTKRSVCLVKLAMQFTVFFFTDVPLIFLGNLLGIHNFTKRTLQFSMIDLKA
jgi:hypothetical protein